jgi:hypothetical protein
MKKIIKYIFHFINDIVDITFVLVYVITFIIILFISC